MKIWPPEYTVRKSTRAKHVQLQFAPHKGLEIVVPKRVQHVDIEALLTQHRRWIEQKLSHAPQTNPSQVGAHHFPPQHLCLPPLFMNLTVSYQERTGSKTTVTHNEEGLIIHGQVSDRRSVIQVLQLWLHQQATRVLLPWLYALSCRTGLSYQKAAIRGQRACWGSCSSQGHISLNYKLLFLEARLVEHVLLHELCHLRHLDHSPAFKQLLQSFDAQAEPHRQALVEAQGLVPNWLEH